MIYWLVAIVLAYFFFGLGSFGDKLVLAGKPKPKSYTFYVGVFGLSVLLLLPFAHLGFPTATGLFWIVLDAIVRILGIYTMFVAIERFDVSKVMATIGATQPIFILLLTSLFWGPQAMTGTDILAFILLFIGSVIISVEKNIEVTGSYLKITILSSLLFSLDYILVKLVFLNQPFLQAIIWLGLFVFLFVLVFLIGKNSRKEILAKNMVTNKKTQASFFFAQISGGIANFLQGYSIFLAPVAFLAIINSLRGIQYIFLFLITLFVSFFLPKILKEKISKKIILQKMISIIFIAAGLAILVI